MMRFSELMLGTYFEGDNGGGGAPPPPATPPATPPGGGEPQVFSRDYVESLRGESANHRTRAKEAERKLAELETAGQATAAQLKAAEEKAASASARVVKAEVKVAAATAGIVDPDTAYLLIKDAVKLNAEGDPENVVELLKQLALDKPYLVKQEGGGGGSPANPAGGRGGGGGGVPGKVPRWDDAYKKK